jgi:hypothetical protein
MPAPVVKSYAKKSGHSTGKVEKDWDDSKGAAKKAGLSPDSDSYWKYVNSVTRKKQGISDSEAKKED